MTPTNRDEARERLAAALAMADRYGTGGVQFGEWPEGVVNFDDVRALLSTEEVGGLDQPHPTATPKSAVGEQGWKGIETAPNNRPFWARKSNNEIALCWRHNPSSRTDEVMTWKGNQGFKAVEWRAPDPLPSSPAKGGE